MGNSCCQSDVVSVRPRSAAAAHRLADFDRDAPAAADNGPIDVGRNHHGPNHGSTPSSFLVTADLSSPALPSWDDGGDACPSALPDAKPCSEYYRGQIGLYYCVGDACPIFGASAGEVWGGGSRAAAGAAAGAPAGGGPSDSPSGRRGGAGGGATTAAASASDANNSSLAGAVLYTADSCPCRAARHAGVIGPRGGNFVVQVRPGRVTYEGSDRCGVRSSSHGCYDLSIEVAPAPHL